jgi:CheY-like chemotaxis protein
MSIENELVPELKRALQSMRSAVNMLRQAQPDAGAVAFMCAGAEKRLEQIIEAAEGNRPKGRRVLVADPEQTWTEVLAETLRLEGHDVRTAASVEDTLAACSAFRPDAVVLELAMTGHEGLRNVSSLGGTAVLLAVTRWSRDRDRDIARQAGVEHFLHKPVSPVAVARLVSVLPERRAVEATPIAPRKRAARTSR